MLAVVRETNRFVATSMKKDISDRTRQLIERRVKVEPEMRRQGLEHLEVIGMATVPAPNCPSRETQLRMYYDPLRVEEGLHA